MYKPQEDTRLLLQALRQAMPRKARVLDVGTGTGVLAVTAAQLGAEEVVAVDITAPAVWSARVNSRLRLLSSVRVVRGGIPDAVLGERFDLVVSNPPYVPANGHPPRGRDRAWDAGLNGRDVLDLLCAKAPGLLAPGGTLLLVQSSLSGVEDTVCKLEQANLASSIVARKVVPFGPVMQQRAPLWEQRGCILPGRRHEELVVIRAQRNGTE